MFNNSMQYKRSGLTLAVLIFGLGASPAQAELRRIEQGILGMDCAPCAYGMQQGLGKLAGVSDVEVSLNDARVRLALKPGNDVTLAEIREVIVNGGFKPTQASVSVLGTLERQDGDLILKAGDALAFKLTPAEKADEAWNRLQAWPQGETVLIEGRVEYDEPTGRLSVGAVSAAAKPAQDQEQP